MFDFNVDSKKISLQNFVNTSDIQRYLVVKKKKKKTLGLDLNSFNPIRIQSNLP